MDLVGQVITGEHGRILVRQKAGQILEIGELLIAKGYENDKFLLQVYNLVYGSQLESRSIEMMSGMYMEGTKKGMFFDKDIRSYILAEVKALLHLNLEGGEVVPAIPKSLPPFFNELRPLRREDMPFLKRPKKSLFMGNIRSGSKVLDLGVYIDGMDAVTHHILIPATTGRGKSNLMKVMLWDLIPQDYCGVLVLDPHDEYYGRGGNKGLKDHPAASDRVEYYTPPTKTMPPGAVSLTFSLSSLRPWHFNGIIHFTDAQNDALYVYYRNHGENWLEFLLLEDPYGDDQTDRIHGVQLNTLAVLQRKLKINLNLEVGAGQVRSRNNVFSPTMGEGTVQDIVRSIEDGKKVIVDSSRLNDRSELIIGSIIAHELLDRYKDYKANDALDDRPVVSIVIEEAPRVLGGEAASVFGAVAREGRKFKVGLMAITQLVKMIPHQVLANMNTKIILGNEMSDERRAIISSASQDLTKDDKMISSLDKGEAIVSSVFTRFAIPIKIPLFEEYIEAGEEGKGENGKTLKAFMGG